jgi:ribosomal protein L37E
MYSADELYSDEITSSILTGKEHCRGCGRTTRHVQDGYCPRCCGLETDEDVRAANRRAWQRRRETGLAFPGRER